MYNFMMCACVFVGVCKCVGVCNGVRLCSLVCPGVSGCVLGGVIVAEYTWVCFVHRCVFVCSGMCMRVCMGLLGQV